MPESFLLTDGFRNMPGLSYFNFVELQGIAAIADPVNSIISTNITLKSGYNWLRGDIVHTSGNFEAGMKITEAGPKWDVEISGFYPKITPALEDKFYQMQNYRWVVVPKDQNQYKRLLGSKFQGARFFVSEDTGNLGGDKINGYRIGFAWEARRSPLFYLPAEEDAYLIPDDVTYTPTGTHSTFYYYNTSDPSIAAVPAATNKRKFSVLAGKSITDFAIWLNGNKLISNDPDAGDNIITAIAVDGTVTLSVNWGNNREILIILK